MPKRKGLPNLNELVLVTVRKLTQFAAWCKLEEYPEAEGMIHISEVAGKWVYDIRDYVKVGKQYVTKVMKVDKEKKFVTLSLKRVSVRDRKEKLNIYRKEQRAEKILEQAAKELGKTLDQAYEEVGHLLQEKFGELFVALEEIKKSPEVLKELGIEKKWADALQKIVEKTLKEKEIKLRVNLILKNYSSDGIVKIKNVLNQLEKTGVTVKYISAPNYRVELITKDPKNDEKKLRKNLDAVIKQMEKSNGEGSYTFIRD